MKNIETKKPSSTVRIIKAELYFEVEGQFDPSLVKRFLTEKLESIPLRKVMSLHNNPSDEGLFVKFYQLPKALGGRIKRIKAITSSDVLGLMK